ncbi:MAG: hypothetical protein QOJ85_1332 [Solirubrobacteraceae bacterium]|jgi:hypothetical protein|nr:hypothetical protein [Solirubrobacteraceae bacterium]
MPVLGNSSRVSSISRSVVSRVEVTDGELSEVITQQHNGVRAVDGFGADGPHDLRQGTFPAWESQCGPARGAWATVARVRRREQRADQERARERHARRRRLPWPDHPHWQRQRGGEQRAAAERTVDLGAGVVWLTAERRGSRRHAGRFARASSEVRPAARRASAVSACAEPPATERTRLRGEALLMAFRREEFR